MHSGQKLINDTLEKFSRGKARGFIEESQSGTLQMDLAKRAWKFALNVFHKLRQAANNPILLNEALAEIDDSDILKELDGMWYKHDGTERTNKIEFIRASVAAEYATPHDFVPEVNPDAIEAEINKWKQRLRNGSNKLLPSFKHEQ
jgi:hypothetical protein